MCLVLAIRLLHPADMSLLARMLLTWTAASIVVSPIVGALLHRAQLESATEPVR